MKRLRQFVGVILYALSALFLHPAMASEGPVPPYTVLAGGIGNDTIYSSQTICYNTIPVAFTGTTPTGGIGVYTYKWQSSTTSATAGFATIGGAIAQGYAPGALTATRWYRRIVTSGAAIDTTAAIQIMVTPVIVHASNTISTAQSICFNTTPASLTGSTPTGGDGTTYAYTWQSSPDNATWTVITGATGIGYSPGALSATTYYRRIVASGGCTDAAASIKITVFPVLANNIVKTDQSICTGQTPLALTGTTPTGGSGTYTYLWQSSTISATTGFATASGTTNGIGYTPASLTQTTWFRRVVSSGGCTDTAAAVTITVVTSAPGNPAIFGNNVWNVYGYSDATFSTYAGYYTEPSLSFATTSRYTTAQSPSYASGYQGCLIPTTNFSVSMKRTNFTPGDYQVDLTALDDNMSLWVNGVQVYTRGCCTAASNIWTGYLAAFDQVEIRWTQATGPSQLALNFTLVTPAPLAPGGIGSNQSVCYGDPASAGFTSTASATTGCTFVGYQWQSSVDSVVWTAISGATAATYTVPYAMTQTTWYRRVAMDACNISAATVPVKITVNVIPPGDPTVFGDNVWNAYAYTYPAGNTAFSAATYKGFYVEPSLSFSSTSRWPNGGSPSVASGYQGCYVTPTYNWMVYKRTDFAPGIYQIDIPAHDDWAYLYINGNLVFSHLGCCDVHTNVWTGTLGVTDQIEFRVLQGAGSSVGAITLTPVTPAPLTAGTITPSQTICAGDNPPTPMTQATAPTGGCTIQSYQWQSSSDNGTTWNNISGATASGYTIAGSVYTQTLYRRMVYDACSNSAASVPDTVYMNNSAPGNPAVFGNNIWNVYCFQDVNYSIYSGYYTEPSLTFLTTSRYASTATPSSASGYAGCQLINSYYSVSMKRTGFTAGIYQLDVTADDDFVSLFINGALVSSLTYPTVQNNVWTGPLGPSDQIEVRWRNNAGPGQCGIRFTTVTPTPLSAGSINAYNPNLCSGDVPIINNTAVGTGGCFINYSWQSSTDGGSTWTTIPGATDTGYTASVSPTLPTQFRRVAADVCGNTAYTSVVTFTPGAGAVGNPSVFGNGVWNAYCYSVNGAAFSTAIYMGYYTEPLLSFSSLTRWANGGSPSNASGYLGCQVSSDNHWVSYRRTNFTTATYQLDIPTHDDDVYLYINGVLVFTHVGCCDSHTNVWTGVLGPTDQVEFRWREFSGGSNGALNLTVVTPSTAIVGGTIGTAQTICSNTAPVAFTNVDSAHSSCFIYYQWQSQTNCTGAWNTISGATGLTYAPGALTTSTCYRRMATNSCGVTAWSNTVTISIYSTVVTPGTIAASQTICSGATPAALTATTTPTGGDGNYVYQWQSSPDGVAWSNITGATAATLSPGSLTTTTWYRRNVSACAAASTASSAAVTITVNQPPVITVQPANAVACSGNNTSISVTATGTTPGYQWQVNTGSGWGNVVNNATYGGATTATLAITGATVAMNGYQYRVLINGACTPALTSNVVTLTIGITPSISAQPTNTSACAGSTTGFNVTASGSGLTYQWQQKIGAGAWTSLSDGGVYSGTHTAALVLTGIITGMNSYQYQCIVMSSCGGAVTSSAAVLTVVTAITNTITADQSVCTGMNAATLSGTSSGAYTYQWQSSTVSSSTGFVNAAAITYNYNPNPITATTWYRRVVNNSACSSTSNVVTVTLNPSTIAITAQPVNQAICAGGTATYSVTASGPGTLTYQWYEFAGSTWTALTDAGIYSGSATSTLTITGAGSGMNGYLYYVRIFASGCTVNSLNSNGAGLTTNNAPVVTSTNPDIITCSGTTIPINITATGIGLTYQWQQNTGSGWNNLSNFGVFSNVTTNSLHITGTTVALNGTQYRCIVSGACAPGTATSGVVNLTVNPPVTGNSISSSQTLCAGTPAPFTVTTPTGGDGAYTYQWQQNTGSGWSYITGATAINYSPGVVSQTTSYIRTVFDGACASNNSISISVTITPATSVTDPVGSAVCAGTNTSFSVTATGTAPAYQWQVNTGSGWSNVVNGSAYTGATSTTLNVLAPAYSMNGYQYHCVVTGNCAPATVSSNAAVLTVNPVATITSQPQNVSSCQGSTVTFGVTATGSGLVYQWQEKVGSGVWTSLSDGGVYGGTQTATLTLTGISTTMNTNQYRCLITYGSCPVNSNAASLTVNQQPSLVITSPAPVCFPGTVNITAPAVTAGSSLAGGTLTYWKDAAATVPLPGPAAVSLSGTYYIRVATSPVCLDIKPVIVTINPLPVASVSYAGNPYCATGTAIVTQTGVTGGTYSAAGGLSLNASTGAVDLVASTPGTYTVSYAFNNGTCSNTTSTSITIKALPTATISYAGNPYCATGTATVTRTGTAGGVYSAPAGLSLNASTGAVDLVASTSGTYTVSYAFTNGTCNNTVSTSITINALPTASISYAGSPYCATGTATVTQTGPGGGVYSAPAGLSLNASTGAVDLVASTAGTYIVTYAFTNGTCSNTTSTSITINALPTASISYAGSPYCAVGTATVTQTGPGGGVYSAPAGLSINASTGDVDLVASTAGTYTVSYAFTNGTCGNTASTTITIKALPVGAISYAGSPYCAAGTATVTQTGPGGGVYSAPAGLSLNVSTGAVDLVASTPGTYTVSYAFTNGTCNNTTTSSITINALPTATISYSGSPYCATGTATVTQTGPGGGVYSAPAGLSLNATTGAVDLVASTAGTYTVNYTFTNGTCNNTVSTSITINALPTASILYAGNPYCALGTATVTQTGPAGGTYSAPAGLSVDATTGAVDLVASTAGTYTVSYAFSNGTCSNTVSTSITINALPAASISYAGSPYCAVGTATVTQTGIAGGTYSAPAALSINATTGVVDLVASTAGTYTVTYTFSNGTCSNTTSASITINALPTASISYAGNPYCATGTATVTQTGPTGGTYNAPAGLSLNASTGAVDLVASTAGTYTVTYAFTNGTCNNTTTTSITINALPTASISYAGGPFCTLGTATVTQTGPSGGVYSAPAGLSLNASTGAIDLVASTPGMYTVMYSFTNGICSNSTTTSILIRNPAVVITDPPAVCSPLTVDLTKAAVTAGSDAGLSFTYYTDASGTTTLAGANAVTTGSTYYIKGTNTSTGCMSSIQPVVVQVNTPPTMSLSANTDVCKGSLDTLVANSPGNTIVWTGLGTGATMTVTPVRTTTYQAIATNAPGCSDTATITVQVRPFALTLTATPEPALSGTTVTLTTSANFAYQVLSWQPSFDFTDQTAFTQTVTVRDTAHFYTVIAQSSQGCLDTATYEVKVDVNTKDLFIPNAFTPNNDGKNDVFKVYGSSIRQLDMRVFNQWGELVFESHDQQKGWDGNIGGRQAPVGIYVYAVNLVFYNDAKLSKKGTVSLIR